jgi:hypothetical protein
LQLQCSFHKKPYDVIFGKPLKAELIETVLQGDMMVPIRHPPAREVV